MLISEAVLSALNSETWQFNIVADWIEDNFSGHPEAGLYCRRLRDAENLRVQTVFDVIGKFGRPNERRRIGRIRRLIMKLKNVSLQIHAVRLRSIKGLYNRININKRFPKVSLGTHPKTLRADFKKHRVCSDWWVVIQLKRLLELE
jgi:hypothetical protein